MKSYLTLNNSVLDVIKLPNHIPRYLLFCVSICFVTHSVKPPWETRENPIRYSRCLLQTKPSSSCYSFRNLFSSTTIGDENPIRTLGDYSRPSHEGYRNTIELPEGNNVCEIDRAAGGKLRNKNADESWEIIKNLALYDHEGPSPQPQALNTTFEARLWDYMAAHTERMERFKNTIFMQREEINGRMTEMFGLLKELTTSRTSEKVLIREDAKFPVTNNLNSISLTKEEE
ncbi:hypothetical protein Tco_0895818 [Tanacetum coccineum]|uniref:Uncharacterized protein n=1 Tax=Tanacetum coccineum TaxID=301880 RepID=A0ABQ5CFN5_9ASTR